MGIKQDTERGRQRQRQRNTARTCSSSSICITENSSIIARAFKCGQLRRACYELRPRRSVNRGSTRGVGGWGFTKLATKIDAKKHKPKGKKTKATSLHVRSGTHANPEKHLPRWLPPPPNTKMFTLSKLSSLSKSVCRQNHSRKSSASLVHRNTQTRLFFLCFSYVPLGVRWLSACLCNTGTTSALSGVMFISSLRSSGPSTGLGICTLVGTWEPIEVIRGTGLAGGSVWTLTILIFITWHVKLQIWRGRFTWFCVLISF